MSRSGHKILLRANLDHPHDTVRQRNHYKRSTRQKRQTNKLCSSQSQNSNFVLTTRGLKCNGMFDPTFTPRSVSACCLSFSFCVAHPNNSCCCYIYHSIVSDKAAKLMNLHICQSSSQEIKKPVEQSPTNNENSEEQYSACQIPNSALTPYILQQQKPPAAHFIKDSLNMIKEEGHLNEKIMNENLQSIELQPEHIETPSCVFTLQKEKVQTWLMMIDRATGSSAAHVSLQNSNFGGLAINNSTGLVRAVAFYKIVCILCGEPRLVFHIFHNLGKSKHV